MQTAFLLYDGFSALDITGPYDVLRNLPGCEPVFVAEQRGPLRDESGTLALVADRRLDEVPAPHVLVVPGGFGTRALLTHEPLLSWIRTAHETTTWTTSVCTGSLLLAAAGLLDDAPASTHWLARDTLASLGARPVPERVVAYGRIITAAGVSAGIDMALRLVQLIHGDAAAQAVQLGIEYDPDPPFDAGSPDKAPPAIVEAVRHGYTQEQSVHGASGGMRRIVIAGFPGVQALDVAGPAEVFSIATRLGVHDYEVAIAASAGRRIRTSSGLELTPHRALTPIRGAVDTLIAPGGVGTLQALDDASLMRWIGRTARRARRIASVCTGAFLLAEAGLLDGHRVTTHWSACSALRRRYPAITVEEDPIFIRQGNVWTSAGVTAGMDLALALLEEDAGNDAALAVARQLVMFVRRPGGQAQFSAQLAARTADRDPLRDVQAWIVENLGSDLTVEALSDRAHMSPRNFARAFKREIGVTPAAYVERARVERAQQLLQRPGAGLQEVALQCGFGSEDRMRRSFQRRLGVGPAAYRDRFRPALLSAA